MAGNDNGAGWTDIPGAVSLGYGALPTTAGVYSYRLTAAQSGNISISSCKVASPPVTVVVLKIPSPAVTISAGSTTIVRERRRYLPQWRPTWWKYPFISVEGEMGRPCRETGPVYTSTTFADADKVSCVMTSNAACVVKPVRFFQSRKYDGDPYSCFLCADNGFGYYDLHDSMVTFTAAPFNVQ